MGKINFNAKSSLGRYNAITGLSDVKNFLSLLTPTLIKG